MVSAITHEKCFNHGEREAAACCPRCRRFFCRECVTEHDDRVICAACLRQLAARDQARRVRRHYLRLAAGAAAGFALVWLAIYGVGRVLLLLPTRFHEGALPADAATEAHDD